MAYKLTIFLLFFMVSLATKIDGTYLTSSFCITPDGGVARIRFMQGGRNIQAYRQARIARWDETPKPKGVEFEGGCGVGFLFLISKWWVFVHSGCIILHSLYMGTNNKKQMAGWFRG